MPIARGQISEHLRLCSLMRLPVVLSEQLQAMAQRWHIPCIARPARRTGTGLADFSTLSRPRCATAVAGRTAAGHRPGQPQRLRTAAPERPSNTRVASIFGNADGFAVPYHDAQGVAAWLLCGCYPVDNGRHT
jgi:hypothetical protein